MYEAKQADRERQWEFQDTLNAVLCDITVKCHAGAKTKPDDFRIFRPEKARQTKEKDTPEMMAEKLKLIALAMGGKVVDRG